jgi:tetratricopeptide (TPR) repeat protein
LNTGLHAGAALEEADLLFNQGNYQACLSRYEELLAKNPTKGDRALFEMGMVLSHPKNEQKDYPRALECFRKLVKEYPRSEYRQNSQSMIFYINNIPARDMKVAAQQTQIGILRKEVESRENEIAALQKKIKALEEKVLANAIRNRSADKLVIEKKARRLMLISKGEVLKTYKIALGGNPVGPKEMQGDGKTPEGTYYIDARNRDSRYHWALHISYPNERDRKRARRSGVAPGGNIMIHGIKNGFSWLRAGHAEVDWTKGCIAVTDEEIEEIAKLAPNGTMVEIRP